MKWKSEGKKMFFGNRSVAFENNIRQFVECTEKTVVLLEVPPTGPFDSENVYCISSQGNVLWRIEGDKTSTPSPFNVYIQIISANDDVVTLTTYDCYVHSVDMESGKRIETRFTK